MTQDDLRTLIDKTDRLAVQAEEAAVASREAAGQLSAATMTLAEDQTERRQFEKLMRTNVRIGAWVLGGIAVLAVAAAIMLINIIVGRGATRAKIEATKAQTEEIRHLAELMVDCTTDGGDCYQRGQSRTASAVKAINDAGARVLTTVAVCRYKPDPTEFFACLSSSLPDLEVAGVPGAPKS